jgi:hypothetical protein
MANHECPSICSRRYMGSFRWQMRGGIASSWELILENGQWLGCWITDRLCALPITGWTGIHGFGYLSPLIRIAPFSAHKLIRQDTAVLHQATIV